MSLVTGLFKDQDSAQNAYKSLTESGYTTDEIDVVMSEETRGKYYEENTTLGTEVWNKSAESAAARTILALPDLGLVISGPIAVAIADSGKGEFASSIVGALVDWGVPADRLKAYEQGINDGGILIGITSKSVDDAHRFDYEWNTLGVSKPHSYH
jgi:hypothetical protein